MQASDDVDYSAHCWFTGLL